MTPEAKAERKRQYNIKTRNRQQYYQTAARKNKDRARLARTRRQNCNGAFGRVNDPTTYGQLAFGTSVGPDIYPEVVLMSDSPQKPTKKKRKKS